MNDLLNQIIAWESGEMDGEQEIAFFQQLVDTGLAWQLQGIYGRTAAAMIKDGLITVPARPEESNDE